MNNLGDLEIFARVVTAGSMSAAGRELGLSPAVVSKRLRRLEDRLGTRLLQRTTRQISLTEAGQGFYERVVAILAGIEEAEAFVSRRSALARGVLKVSAPTSFGRMHIVPHINAFTSLIHNHPHRSHLLATVHCWAFTSSQGKLCGKRMLLVLSCHSAVAAFRQSTAFESAGPLCSAERCGLA